MMVSFKLWVAIFAALAFAYSDTSAQNLAKPDGTISRHTAGKLPSWMGFSGEERVRMERLSGLKFQPGRNRYLLQRLRLNCDLTPLPWLRFSLQAQDSRVFFSKVSPAPASQKNSLDLRLGYVQIGSSESGPVSVRAGRQSLAFGEGRLMGDPNWSNVGRTLDGLRVTVRYRKIRLDAFTGASDRISTEGFDTPVPGEHIHGLYGSIDRLIPQSSLEPYLFWKLEHNVKGEATRTGRLDVKTAGLRWLGKLPSGWDYGVEMAVQRGRQANEPVSSWAGHWVAGRTLANTRHRPRLFAEFNRATGDRDACDGMHGAFDPLFPSAHDKFGTADQFTWTDIAHVRSGMQFTAHKTISMTMAYNSFWHASRPEGSAPSHIAQEADAQAQWKPRRDTQVDFALGHIFPGESLRQSGRDSAYECWLLGVTHRF